VAATDLARDLLDLALPVTCAGCGAPGRALCPACLHRWSGPPRRCEQAAGRLDRMDGTTLPVWALAENDGPVRRAVVAWKDGGRADVTPWLAAVVARAATGVAAALPAGPGRLLVVPAPASPQGRARRGEDLVGTLATAHAAALGRAAAAAGAGRVVPAPALRLAGGGRDQVGLGVHGRAANLAGRVRVRRRWAPVLAGSRVLLLDDVLTTGATLAACRTVLERAGALVAGALVLAVTRPPGSPTGWLEASTNPG
jgi:predicted amidophosphoribosyltransferase